jgi:hypothetical protein
LKHLHSAQKIVKRAPDEFKGELVEAWKKVFWIFTEN